MNLSAFAIKYRAIVLTMVALLLLWGIYSVRTMPQREDPEYTVRTCLITTAWPGAPAEKVEELITKPIEEMVDRIDEVDVVRSTTNVGVSTIYVDAEETVTPEQIDNVWDKVRARIQLVQMPEQGINPVVNDEFGDTNIILFAVYQTPLPGKDAIQENNRYGKRELDVITEKIKDELRLVPGVAKAEQYGVQEEAIYVETDLAAWSQIKLTVDQLEQLTAKRNIIASGGTIDTEAGRFSVKPGGEFNAMEEMESITAAMAGTADQRRPVYLKDLGLKIERKYTDPPQLIYRFTSPFVSENSIVVALTMKSGGNIVDICKAAKARILEMQLSEQSLPPDIAVQPVSDQSENVQVKIRQVVSNVIGAILIVVLVVYLVVGFRSALVMAANIPIVVLAAIALITLFDVQLEQISLASIIIALGLLVDNAVQICDQSRTNQIKGMDPVTASVTGSNQVASPMLMGTATTVAAFAPMLVGLVGSKKEYIYSLPVTLSVTLAISWVLAMTFCTLLASAFIRAPKNPDQPSAPLDWLFAKLTRRGRGGGGSDPIDKLFRGAVRIAINSRVFTIGIAIILFVIAAMLPVGSEFFPQDLRDQFAIEVWLPENVTIAQTDRAAQEVENILQKLSPTEIDGQTVQRVMGVRTSVGGGGARWYLGWDPEPRKPNYAEILVRTTRPEFTPQLAKRVREIAEHGDEALKLKPVVGARVIPQQLFMGPSSPPVEIRVMGPGFADMKSLRGFAERVKKMVRDYPGTWDVNDSWGIAGYQLSVNVDEDRANMAGVSNARIAQSLNTYFNGHQLTTFREGDHQVPVYLRLTSEERSSLDGLERAFVEGASGKIPLNSVATIDARWEPAQIRRRDLNRMIEVRSQVEAGVRGNDVVNAVIASDEMAQLKNEMPPGFQIEVGGSLEDSTEGAEQLSISLGISVLTIVLLLVIQYNGWAKPIIILATLPLALIGALPGLWLTGNALGFMPQLGILSLFGIVLNTGIIFIEFADVLVREKSEASDGSGPIHGLSIGDFRECLVDAAKQRLLPIFLTTATTIGGLLPLATSGGPLWEGMAWCMIFGLIVATVLTLVVVPAMYALFVERFGMKAFS